MFLAVRHLVELGHRDILFVQNSQEAEAGTPLLSHRYRSQGLKEAMRKYRAEGVKAQVVDIPGPGAQAGLNAIRSVLGSRSFTAVVCINDMVAIGVYRGLNEANLRIPQDVSVIGFDNIYLSEFLNPPLSTIHIPRDELSKLAVEMLLQQLGGNKVGYEVKLATELVIRKSTGPPASAR
jgi:LacI family transcriptional regulator